MNTNIHNDFELIPHTADIKIRVYGSTLEELFSHALLGMFQSIGPNSKSPGCTRNNDRLVCETLPIHHTITLDAPDREALLVDFLSEALYLSDINNEAYFVADLHELTDTHIDATIHGIPITGFDVVEIKAVTYHDLYIKHIDNKWQAEIVFDI